MRRSILSILTILALILPTSARAQSGDASWLENLDGLQTSIGRSWMAPITSSSESTYTELNEDGTPVFEISTRTEPSSTPVPDNQFQTLTLSALIFEFDTPENAAAGLEQLHADQLEQLKRDPRSPATNAFATDDLGDLAYGQEGIYESPSSDGGVIELAVVYLMVQDGSLVYQIFGQFLPGTHIELATGVATSLLQTNIGSADPVYNMNGGSTGGNWEKLNAVEIAMPPDSTVNDLEIYPVSDDAVMGDSVIVPVIDLDNLAKTPGLTESWHIAYGDPAGATPVATPVGAPDGVYNIELWVMEFTDATNASAAFFSLQSSLGEPLLFIGGESWQHSGEVPDGQSIGTVLTGFVQDRSIPEGDAAVALVVIENTVYAARVYANGPAPTPIARDLVTSLIDTPAGSGEESADGTGGGWDRFPPAGSETLYGLDLVVIRHDQP